MTQAPSRNSSPAEKGVCFKVVHEVKCDELINLSVEIKVEISSKSVGNTVGCCDSFSYSLFNIH